MVNPSVKTKVRCSICTSTQLESAISLPTFPLTGIFLEKVEKIDIPIGVDQELMNCLDCGHLQLRNVLSPIEIYSSRYAHRSSESHLSPDSVSFLIDFINIFAKDRVFNSILEIGCNDLFLLERMRNRANLAFGIDPIWRNAKLPSLNSELHVIGKILEEVNFESDLEVPPDLIISTHNLEHIDEPVQEFRRLMEFVNDDALFIIEVPNADLMINNLRFDQVFHYHLHYFGLSSALNFIKNIGGKYLGHSINYKNWGGSLVLAFGKKNAKSMTLPQARQIDLGLIKNQYKVFRQRLAAFMGIVHSLNCNVWAYGAGQMLPSLAYNLESDFSFLEGILDDNPRRWGLRYPHISPQIYEPTERLGLRDAAIIITAPDFVRPIMNKIHRFEPRYILTPTDIC